jgi:hypothetical protein
MIASNEILSSLVFLAKKLSRDSTFFAGFFSSFVPGGSGFMKELSLLFFSLVRLSWVTFGVSRIKPGV